MTDWSGTGLPPAVRASGHSHFTPQCPIFAIFKKGIIGSFVLKREEKEEQQKNLRRRVIMRIN